MNVIQQGPATRSVRIFSVDPVEQARRVEEAIARRAYQIFERHGGMGWHELEDWRQAESEVRSKLCFSLSSSDDSLLVGFDVARFEQGSVEVWIAPRQMTIWGRPIRHQEQSPGAVRSYDGIVFRTIALPVEIEPGRAVANIKRGFVEIRLPMTRPKYEEQSRMQAA